MISRNYRFDEFIQEMRGRDLADVLAAGIEEDTEAQREDRSTRSRRISYRPALAYSRKLGAFVFFLHHGVKPLGLSQDDFQLVKPLCEDWIKKGQMLEGVLRLFASE